MNNNSYHTRTDFLHKSKAYLNHGLVLIDSIGTSCSISTLSCISSNKNCCSIPRSGEFYFPNEHRVPILANISDGYYRNRQPDRVSLNRINGTIQGIFRCEIRTEDSGDELRPVYIGVYDANSG